MKTIIFGFALLWSFMASAQPQVPRQTYFLSTTTNLAPSTTIVSSNTTMQLYRGRGFSLMISATGTNGLLPGSNINCRLQFTPDGTNWLTTPIVTVPATLNSNTAIRPGTNFSAAFCEGFRSVRLLDVANTHTGYIWITNISGFVSP